MVYAIKIKRKKAALKFQRCGSTENVAHCNAQITTSQAKPK